MVKSNNKLLSQTYVMIIIIAMDLSCYCSNHNTKETAKLMHDISSYSYNLILSLFLHFSQVLSTCVSFVLFSVLGSGFMILSTVYIIVSPVRSTYGGYYGLVVVTPPRPRPQTLHRSHDNLKNPYRIASIFDM